MSINQLDAEQEAISSLMEFLDHAKKCQRLYERAHMALPEPLKRVLGMNGAGGNSLAPRFTPAPESPSRPAEATSDWIPIRVEDATPTSIALAILRAAKEPIRAKDIVSAVQAVLPDVRSGSVANIGSRLHGTLLRRTNDGWTLEKPESAGVIADGFLWGPPTIFGKQELAAHRRDAIRHILSSFPAGLQTSQIIEELKKCASWVRAPINKELVQDDMEILGETGKVRRRGNSKKWELTPSDKKDDH
jgi:hypothetical protein